MRENASAAAVDLLARRWDDPDVTLVTAVLPVEFDAVDAVLDELLATHRPDAVLAVGEAGGRTVITPEASAANRDHGVIPDNAGVEFEARPIDDGPQARSSRLDVEDLVRRCRADGIAAEVSHDAGAFLCNHVFHHLLTRTDLPAGFVHIPALRSQGLATVGAETDAEPSRATPEVTLEECARALAHGVRMLA